MMSPKVTRSGAPDDKSPSVASRRTTEAAEAASVDDSAFILVIDSPTGHWTTLHRENKVKRIRTRSRWKSSPWCWFMTAAHHRKAEERDG